MSLLSSEPSQVLGSTVEGRGNKKVQALRPGWRLGRDGPRSQMGQPGTEQEQH